MKYKLKPQTAILIAGLVSAAYGQTCYYTTSMVCYYSGATVDTCNMNGNTAPVSIKASAEWDLNYSTTVCCGGGHSTLPSGNVYCSGPAHFSNPVTSHDETISYWQDYTCNYGTPSQTTKPPVGTGTGC
jgi:hypothetical protein